MQTKLATLRTGLRIISGSPSPQTLRDLSQKAAEDFLTGVISQENFRQAISENEFLRLQGEAFALAKPKITASERTLDEEVSRFKIAEQQRTLRNSEAQRQAAETAKRQAKASH